MHLNGILMGKDSLMLTILFIIYYMEVYHEEV